MGGGETVSGLSEHDFKSWPLASVAFKKALGAFSNSKLTTCNALIHRLCTGRLAAAAGSVLKTSQLPGEREKAFVLIPKEHWNYISAHPSDSLVWVTDDLEIWAERGSRRYQYCEIRFDPAGLAEIPALSALPDSSQSETPAAQQMPVFREGKPDAYPLKPSKHPGGAPLKDIWERVWIEVAARLYEGDLQPKKQKDIEDAIIEIAASLGDDMGEATARRHAKPLWDRIKPGS